MQNIMNNMLNTGYKNRKAQCTFGTRFYYTHFDYCFKGLVDQCNVLKA